MRQCLALVDQCLTRYDLIARDWDQAKQWDRLSPQRITECEERRHFLSKIRAAQDQTIRHAEHKTLAPQASN